MTGCYSSCGESANFLSYFYDRIPADRIPAPASACPAMRLQESAQARQTSAQRRIV